MLQSKTHIWPGLLLLASAITALALHVELWLFELLVSFAPLAIYVLGVLLTGTLIFMFLRKTFSPAAVGMLLVASAVCAYSFGFTASLQPIQETRSNGSPNITVTTFNREFSNDTISIATDYIKQQYPDVLVLQETNPDVTKIMSKQMEMKYYYNADRLNMVRGTSAAVVSKHPIKDAVTFRLSDFSSMVKVVVTVPDIGDVAFYSAHFAGPFSPERYQSRNADTNNAADLISKDTLPVVIGGDFNTTIYSPSLQRFNKSVAKTVRSTITEQSPTCSRHSDSIVPCIRIDHVYIPARAQLIDVDASPAIGSDHRAVTVQFKL